MKKIQNIRKGKLIISLLVLAMLGIGISAVHTATAVATATTTGGKAYLTSNTGEPFSNNDCMAAMDSVFGAGKWAKFYYQSASVSALFSSNNEFVYMEGSQNNAPLMSAFLTTHKSVIENWVKNGGRLFINAAPNTGGVINCGFGGVTINNSCPHIYNVNAVGTHPVFSGPYPLVGSTWTGSAFAHAVINGGGVTPLINGDGYGAILAEKVWGKGLVLFSAMTNTSFHSPQPDAFNLRKNIISYAQNDTAATQASVNSLGIDNVNTTTFNIVPNPSNGVFTITNTNLSKETRYDVLNISGEVVYSKKAESATEQLDLSNLAIGTYYLRTTNNGEQTTNKIVIYR